MLHEAAPTLILAVDDEPSILEVYPDLLEEEGYRVMTRSLPIEGPADLAAVDPDLVVLDLMMGRLNWGTTFLEMLRSDPATRHVPVVVCTAAVEVVEQIAPQLEAWGVTVVLKPFDIDAFVGTVRSKLDPGAGERS